MTDDAANKRDARLRKALLLALHRSHVGPKGGLGFQTLVDVVGASVPPDDAFESDDHALGLLRYLVGAGYATEADERTLKAQRFSPAWLFFRVTAKGSQLALGKAPVDPLIDDDRIG